MSPEVREMVRDALAKLLDLDRPRRVVEFGSLNVNGGVRDLLGEVEYIGIDLRTGDGVDVIANAADFEPPWTPDLVLCLSVLEHDPDGAMAIVANAYRILADDGWLICCAPNDKHAPHSWNGGPLPEGEPYQALTPAIMRGYLWEFPHVSVREEGKSVFAVAAKRGAKWIEEGDVSMDSGLSWTMCAGCNRVIYERDAERVEGKPYCCYCLPERAQEALSILADMGPCDDDLSILDEDPELAE